jgi:PIN domain nuclease of toxin-antitoxin system
LIIAGVADTQTAIWYLYDDPRLSAKASSFIQNAANARENIAISSISLAELIYLVEKNRLAVDAYDVLVKALASPVHVFKEAIFSAAIVESMRHIPRDDVPDMPDRMIAATALYFGIPVISRDRRIQASSVDTVW